MPDVRKNFLLKFADLCEEYDVDIYYTNDDDGIHISLGDHFEVSDDVFVGFSFDLPKKLRKAASDLKDEPG